MKSREGCELYIVTDGVMVGILLGEGSQCEKQVVFWWLLQQLPEPAFHVGILHPVISRTLHRLSQYTAPILLCFSCHWAPSQHVHIRLPDDGILKCRKMKMHGPNCKIITWFSSASSWVYGDASSFVSWEVVRSILFPMKVSTHISSSHSHLYQFKFSYLKN
jgi:hypothetical protein